MTIETIRHDTACRLCKKSRITTVFRLEPTPPEDQFVPKEKKHVRQETYPLHVALCEECGYLHLPYILNPEISYTDYIYVTKITLGLANHYQEYADQILALASPEKGSLVVDLGSNDGTMLTAFKRRHMNVVGVEPSPAIAKAANEAGIPTIADFFTAEVVEEILATKGKASIVTANYVYANIDDVVGFTQKVAQLLKPDGIFVVQTGYHPDQMKIRMFDYIYHEHFSYFTLKVLRDLFSMCGLQLVEAQKTPYKGGSIRAIAQLKNQGRKVSPRISDIVREEEHLGMAKVETYTRFAAEIDLVKKEVQTLLRQLQNEGKRIVGYGASHSTTTLTYHFELAPFMEYLVDDNPLKQGMYSPGHHIPVHSPEKLYEDAPDYAIVLAWQYAEPIIGKNQRFLEEDGRFIVPLPGVREVRGRIDG